MDTSRIKKFLESVTDSNLPLDQQPLVFACNEDLMGESNDGICSNKSASACMDNANCTNYGAACNFARNGNCTNESNSYCHIITPPNGAICISNGYYVCN